MTALDDAPPPQGDEIGDFSPVTRRFFAWGGEVGAGEGIRTLDPLLGSRGSTARVAPPPSDLMLNFFSTLRLATGGQTLAFAAAQSESCPSTEKERDGAAWPRSTTSSPPT